MLGKKRKGGSQEPQNIKRWRNDIDAYTQGLTSKDTLQAAQEDGDAKKAANLSRKEKRKEGRKLKKMRRHAFSQHAKLPSVESLEQERQDKIKQKESKRKKQEKRKRQKENKRARVAAEKEEEDRAKEVQKVAVEQDEKAIKQLEKLMKMNKRKSKNLPQSFVNDGLDFILDAVDSDKLKCLVDPEEQAEDLSGPLLDSGSDDDSDIEVEDDLESENYTDEDSEEAGPVPIIEGESANVKSILKKQTDDKGEKKVHFDSISIEQEQSTDKKGNKLASDKDILSFLKKSIAEVKAEKTAEVKIPSQNSSGESDSEAEELEESADEDNESLGSEEEKNDEDREMADEDDDSNEESESDNEDDENDEDDNMLELSSESDEESKGESSEEEGGKEKTEKESEFKEDIYGRLRDKDGNIVSGKGFGAYIPPGKRLQLASTQDAKKKQELERIKKLIKGLINRLSESNVLSISSQIEELFRSHSRAELSEILAEAINGACISVAPIPERLISEQMLLIATLHMNVGGEVGALFLQKVIERFSSLHSQGGNYGEGKQIDNVLVMLGNMYNFKIFQCVLIYDVLKLLVNSFEERDIELLLVLLRNVGFSLRKEDPAALKDIIVKIQDKASSVDTTKFTDESRVKFMLEVLMAIKNNNMRKIPNFDPTHVEHLRKVLRNHCKGSSLLDEQLRITLQDLLEADTKGRWWLVGSAWKGRDTDDTADVVASTTSASSGFSESILELARQQRMNTDVRRNIFCIVMTSEDFVDAFEKLLRLNLKNQQEREIVHVLIDVCLQEKSFNPFYAHLVQKFCEYHRRFQMTVQFNFWDRMKMLNEMTTMNIKHLSAFMTHLIVTKAMSMSVFKTVEFSELDKQKLLLIRSILKGILLGHPEHILVEVFGRIAPFPKLATLREALRVFMRHFLLRKIKAKENAEELEQRIELAEEALGAAEKSSR